MATRLTATVSEWNSLEPQLVVVAQTVASLEATAVPVTELKVTSFLFPVYHPLAPGRREQCACTRTHCQLFFMYRT